MAGKLMPLHGLPGDVHRVSTPGPTPPRPRPPRSSPRPPRAAPHPGRCSRRRLPERQRLGLRPGHPRRYPRGPSPPSSAPAGPAPPPTPVKPREARGPRRASSRRRRPTSRGTRAANRRPKTGPKEIAWAPDVQPPSVPPPLPPVDLKPMVDVDSPKARSARTRTSNRPARGKNPSAGRPRPATEDRPQGHPVVDGRVYRRCASASAGTSRSDTSTTRPNG